MEQGLPDREKIIRGLENRIGESRNHGEIAVSVALSTLEGALRLIREDAWEESAGETLPFRTPPEDRHQGALRPRGVRFRKKEASGNAHGKGAVSG